MELAVHLNAVRAGVAQKSHLLAALVALHYFFSWFLNLLLFGLKLDLIVLFGGPSNLFALLLLLFFNSRLRQFKRAYQGSALSF